MHVVAVNVILIWMVILSHAFIFVKHWPVLVACARRYALKTLHGQPVAALTPSLRDPQPFSTVQWGVANGTQLSVFPCAQQLMELRCVWDMVNLTGSYRNLFFCTWKFCSHYWLFQVFVPIHLHPKSSVLRCQKLSWQSKNCHMEEQIMEVQQRNQKCNLCDMEVMWWSTGKTPLIFLKGLLVSFSMRICITVFIHTSFADITSCFRMPSPTVCCAHSFIDILATACRDQCYRQQFLVEMSFQ